MISIFNCGVGGCDAGYDEDYDDSLYDPVADDMTLRSYRGRAERPAYDNDRSAAERELAAPPPELGTDLYALALRRMSSHKIAVAVTADGGRLSHRKTAVMKHKQQQHRGRRHGYNEEEEPQIVTQLHTIRSPRSYISQKQEEKEQSVFFAAQPSKYKSGVPREICIEIEPGQIEKAGDDEERDSPSPIAVRPKDKAVATCTSEKIGGENKKDARETIGTRPPLPAASKCKHIRIRIRKPLGIVFESLTEGGVRISELPMSGNAGRCGRLEIWDELVSINGRSMKRRTFDEVMDRFAKADPKEKLDLVFRRKITSCVPKAPQDKYSPDKLYGVEHM